MTREKVYEALDSERAYQDEMSQRPDRPDMLEEMHMGDILAAIQYNLTVANGSWYNEATPYVNTTQYLRKIAALCIKAGETFGMEGR